MPKTVPVQKKGFKNLVTMKNKLVLWDKHYPGIYIRFYKEMTSAAKSFFNQDYFHTVVAHLNKIKSKPVGKSLLKRLTAACTNSNGAITVTIEEPDRWHAQSEGGALDPTKTVGTITRANGTCTFTPNQGSSTKLTYNPDFVLIESGARVSSWVTLAHELIHCLHNMEGGKYRDLGGDFDRDTGSAEEEARTCGLGVYNGEAISENAIRAEHKIAARTTYGGHDMSWVTNSLA